MSAVERAAVIIGREYGGTCDWGDCDDLTERLRWADGLGWLPVCYAHSLTDADRAVLDAAEAEVVAADRLAAATDNKEAYRQACDVARSARFAAVRARREAQTPSDDIDLIVPATIDEARLQMVRSLHRAVHGNVWARPESPQEVWNDLLARVTAMRDHTAVRARREAQ